MVCSKGSGQRSAALAQRIAAEAAEAAGVAEAAAATEPYPGLCLRRS